MPRPALLVSALLALAPAALPAQEIDCAEAVTTVEINWCGEQAWMAADGALNAAYADAIALAREIDAEGTGNSEETLREAQRAWVAFRDAACEAEAQPFSPGSIMGAITYGCLERLTLARTDDLVSYVDNWAQ